MMSKSCPPIQQKVEQQQQQPLRPRPSPQPNLNLPKVARNRAISLRMIRMKKKIDRSVIIILCRCLISFQSKYLNFVGLMSLLWSHPHHSLYFILNFTSLHSISWFRSIPFHSTPFLSVLFHSTPFCSIPFHSIPFHSSILDFHSKM